MTSETYPNGVRQCLNILCDLRHTSHDTRVIIVFKRLLHEPTVIENRINE